MYDIPPDTLPGRINETVGVHHMKVYGWDDNVIISGANLSNDYFVNRQDRYVLFHDYDMSHFYYKLIGTFCGFSSHVRPNGTIHNFICILICFFF